MDAYAQSVMDHAASVGAKVLCGPEHFQDYSDARFEKLIPYIALDPATVGEIDYLIVHKGHLHRIGREALIRSFVTLNLDYADAVYLGFARSKAGRIKREFYDHINPLEERFAMDLALGKPAVSDGRSAVIVSAFGVGNVGDDLVSLANKKILHRIGIAHVDLAGPQVSAQQLRHADLISVGGGGLFYDADYQNVANYLYPIQAARELGKPSLVLGVGTQGIKHPYGRQAYKNHLGSADLITVREPGDRDVLCEIDPSLTNVHVTQDLAFVLSRELKPFARGIEREKLALLSPSILLDRTFKMSGTDTRSFCRDLIKALPDHRVIFAIHSDNDEALFRELSVEHQCLALHLGRMGPAGTASLYAAADLVVTSRFHGLIFGCLSGAKIVCVAGKPRSKSTRMIKSFLPSLENSILSSAQYTLDRLQEKLDQARAPDPTEVVACITAAEQNYELVDRWAAERWKI